MDKKLIIKKEGVREAQSGKGRASWPTRAPDNSWPRAPSQCEKSAKTVIAANAFVPATSYALNTTECRLMRAKRKKLGPLWPQHQPQLQPLLQLKAVIIFCLTTRRVNATLRIRDVGPSCTTDTHMHAHTHTHTHTFTYLIIHLDHI